MGTRLFAVQFIVLAAIIQIAAGAADQAESANRNISVPSTVTASTVRNPSITTTGTLTILQSVSFTASATSTTNKAISYSWDFKDGTPLDTRQNPSHIFTAPGIYPVTVTISEAGNEEVAVRTINATITDAVKSSRLLANFDFRKANKDQLKLTGTLRVPVASVKNAPVNVDIGGILLGFTLDDKGASKITTNANVVSGVATTNSNITGSFNIFVKKRPSGVSFEDAKFYLKLKSGSILPALADEFIFNRDADRESLRVTAKINVNGAVYQSTLSPIFSAKKDVKGNLR